MRGLALTTTLLAVFTHLKPLPTHCVTVNVPAAAKVWEGFRSVELVPSPNVQLQALAPVDLSVNLTDFPAVGDDGL